MEGGEWDEKGIGSCFGLNGRARFFFCCFNLWCISSGFFPLAPFFLSLVTYLDFLPFFHLIHRTAALLYVTPTSPISNFWGIVILCISFLSLFLSLLLLRSDHHKKINWTPTTNQWVHIYISTLFVIRSTHHPSVHLLNWKFMDLFDEILYNDSDIISATSEFLIERCSWTETSFFRRQQVYRPLGV